MIKSEVEVLRHERESMINQINRLERRNNVAVKTTLQLRGGLDMKLKNQVDALKSEKEEVEKKDYQQSKPDSNSLAMKSKYAYTSRDHHLFCIVCAICILVRIRRFDLDIHRLVSSGFVEARIRKQLADLQEELERSKKECEDAHKQAHKYR